MAAPSRVVSNTFALLGIAGLTSTANIRRIAEKARVQRAMTGGAKDPLVSDIADRLLQDPVFRLREAAAWYFECSSVEEARSKAIVLGAHDAALNNWQSDIDLATRGSFDPIRWTQACARTADALNNPSSWAPLKELVEAIADARLDESLIPPAAYSAAATWIVSALLVVSNSCSLQDVEAAARVVINARLSQEVMAEASAKVLRHCTDETTGLYEAKKPRVEDLINAIKIDASLGDELVQLVGELAHQMRPWSALVEAFDQDPDAGDEGRALDAAAHLVRNASIAVYNHSTLAREAIQLADASAEIAQTPSLRARFEAEAQRIRCLAAGDEARHFQSVGNLREAESHARRAETFAVAAEEFDGVANLMRSVSVAVYNEGGQAERSLDILERACEIAGSAERRLELQQQVHELRSLAVSALVAAAGARAGRTTAGLKTNPQLILQLESQVQELLRAVEPWRQRILADAPSDKETHAMDAVAFFIRGIAVDVFNNTEHVQTAIALLKTAGVMVLSLSATSTIAEDLRRVTYLAARAGALTALQRGDMPEAAQRAADAKAAGKTPDEATEIAKLNEAIESRRIAGFIKRIPVGYEPVPERRLATCKTCADRMDHQPNPAYQVIPHTLHLFFREKRWLFGLGSPNGGFVLCTRCGAGKALAEGAYLVRHRDSYP